MYLRTLLLFFRSIIRYHSTEISHTCCESAVTADIHGQVGFRPKLKALVGAKTTAKKSMKAVAKSSEKEPMPKLTTQVCADNRRKRKEVLDRRRKRKKLKSLQSCSVLK